MSRTKIHAPRRGGHDSKKRPSHARGLLYAYWEARITTGYDPGTGKQIQRSFSGKTQKRGAREDAGRGCRAQ